jgi:hypothetical protein
MKAVRRFYLYCKSRGGGMSTFVDKGNPFVLLVVHMKENLLTP